MGTIPTPPTFVAGAPLTAAQLNQLRDVQNFWANPPQCQAFDTTGPSLATGATVTVPLVGEVYDIVQAGDAEMHSTTVNTSRITIRTSGKYVVDAYLSFAFNTAGSRVGTIMLNGVTALISDARTASTATSTNLTVGPRTVALVAGDFLEVTALQNSGVALALNTANPGPSRLTARLLAQ